jgi:hypothetical protein
LEVFVSAPTIPAEAPATARPTHGRFAEALVSAAPAADLGEAADVYSWLVGSWEAEVIDFRDDGPPLRQRGEWHFSWILEGRAMQDVWIVPPRGERAGAPAPGNRYGSSLRVYDPEEDVWRVIWINPVTGAENHLVGRREDEEVVQIGRDDDGRLMRWRLTDIERDAFRWLGESSPDDGRTWRLEAEFRGRRLPSRPGASDLPWTLGWEWTDRPGLETVSVRASGDAFLAEGEVLVALDGAWTRVSYQLRYDRSWRFESARLGARGVGAERTIEIRREADGGWTVDGTRRSDLDACTDLDIMVTPFTNTPPLRRLDLGAGESLELRVAWVRLPELTVAPVAQEYRRLDGAEPPTRFLYRNLESGFEGELEVDENRRVTVYGPWRRLR